MEGRTVAEQPGTGTCTCSPRATVAAMKHVKRGFFFSIKWFLLKWSETILMTLSFRLRHCNLVCRFVLFEQSTRIKRHTALKFCISFNTHLFVCLVLFCFFLLTTFVTCPQTWERTPEHSKGKCEHWDRTPWHTRNLFNASVKWLRAKRADLRSSTPGPRQPPPLAEMCKTDPRSALVAFGRPDEAAGRS